MVLGYRVQDSLLTPPLDRLDTLYCGFYGTLILQCIKDGVLPNHLVNEDENLND